MTRRAVDVEKLRVALRRTSRGNLLVVAERAADLVPRVKLRALVGNLVRVEDLAEGRSGAAPLLENLALKAQNVALLLELDAAHGCRPRVPCGRAPPRCSRTSHARQPRVPGLLPRGVGQDAEAVGGALPPRAMAVAGPGLIEKVVGRKDADYRPVAALEGDDLPAPGLAQATPPRGSQP